MSKSAWSRAWFTLAVAAFSFYHRVMNKGHVVRIEITAGEKGGRTTGERN